MKRSIFIFLGLLILTSPAKAWRETGNGGDRTAQEFVSVASNAIDILASIDPPLVDQSVISKLKNALGTTQIFMRQNIYFQDHNTGEVQYFDALNYPKGNPPHIDVSRPRWLQMSQKEQLSIALHEFLGIIELEQNTYQISAAFKRALDRIIK